MRGLALLFLMLAGCATPMPDMPEGIVCVSTLTTTVVTLAKVSSPVTISPNCAVTVK
jgi:hypothetical protein